MADLVVRRLLVCCAFLVLAGCATVHPDANFTKTGRANPGLEKEVLSKFESMQDDDVEVSSEEVTVLVDSVPEGLEISRRTLSVKENYRHQIIGKFKLGTSVFATGHLTLFGFHDYRQNWRKGYCYPQVPLTWVTATFWALVSPTSYPCWARSRMEQRVWLRAVRQLAAAAGGDLAIVTMRRKGTGNRKARGASGFILKADPRMDRQEMEFRQMPSDKMPTAEKKGPSFVPVEGRRATMSSRR